MGWVSGVYLSCVQHDFGFNVITFLIHHIYLVMELPAEILDIIHRKYGEIYFINFYWITQNECEGNGRM